MPNRINQLLLKEYTKTFENGNDVVSFGYEGLNIEGTDALRTQLEERGYEMLFVKNRIAKIAFAEMGRGDVTSILSGQTAFATGEDPVALARFLVDFQKQHSELKIHGALVENTILNDDGVKDLSKSPTKDELKAKIVGQALGPGASVAGALVGPGSTIAGQIKSLIEKLEEGDAA